MARRPSTIRRAALGFSLIEIMVGLMIGMFAMVIVMQVFAAAEGNKRATTGGNDAQTNATLALYSLQRDIRQAGQGISALPILGCSLSYTTATSGEAVTLDALAPVTINSAKVPKGDDNTDTLLVVAGSSGDSSEGDALTGVSTANSLNVTVPGSFAQGDWVIAAAAARAEPCDLVMGRISAAITGSVLTVSQATVGRAVDDIAYNLGASPSVRAYAVRGGQLKSCDYLAYNCATVDDTRWVAVAGGIASLRARYARDTTTYTDGVSMTGVASVYDQTTPASGSDANPMGLLLKCRWARVIGVQLAVVARNAQYEKGYTAATPTWAGSVALPIVIDTTAGYRFKTLEVTAPLRNMIWQGSQNTHEDGSGGC